MRSTYDACVNVERGSGRFDRMKNAMANSSQLVIRCMFDDASKMLLKGIKEIVEKLRGMIQATSDVCKKAIDSVFSILWDTSNAEKSTEMMDPETMKKIRDCRNALLPGKFVTHVLFSPSKVCSRPTFLELNKLVDDQHEACKLLGIKREEIELDVMGVETFEQSLERKMKEAKQKGAVFDFCNSDDEDEHDATGMGRVQLAQIDPTHSSERANFEKLLSKAQTAYDEAFKKSKELQQSKAAALSEYKKSKMTIPNPKEAHLKLRAEQVSKAFEDAEKTRAAAWDEVTKYKNMMKDSEDEHDAIGTKTVKVKAEKTTGSFGRTQPVVGGNDDIIDLCDSDDDEEMNRKPAAKPKGVTVKAEYCSI
jgi:hypothetical protein